MTNKGRFLPLFAIGICTFLLSAAHAMPVAQYDAMSAANQGHYVTLLVKGVYLTLETQGKKAQADKMLSFFLKEGQEGGLKQFEKNLEIVRALNKDKAADPANRQPPYEIEHAFALTLKNCGIIVPLDVLLSINKDFKPSTTASGR